MNQNEKAESNSKRCWCCGDYYPFYTKGFIRYNRERIGYCRKCEKIVGNGATCESWRNNSKRKRTINKFSMRVLNETLHTLSEVTQAILDEEQTSFNSVVREKAENKVAQECDLIFTDKIEIEE